MTFISLLQLFYLDALDWATFVRRSNCRPAPAPAPAPAQTPALALGSRRALVTLLRARSSREELARRPPGPTGARRKRRAARDGRRGRMMGVCHWRSVGGLPAERVTRNPKWVHRRPIAS